MTERDAALARVDTLLSGVEDELARWSRISVSPDGAPVVIVVETVWYAALTDLATARLYLREASR